MRYSTPWRSNVPPDPIPEPPIVYKKSIIFFRSLYAYMRLLPAYHLYRRLRKQNHPLKIGFRVSRGHNPEESILRDSEIGIGKLLLVMDPCGVVAVYHISTMIGETGCVSVVMLHSYLRVGC